MYDNLLEIRIASRALLKAPAFTLTALATLAFGIGLTTAIFSLVQATLLRPLPLPEPERLVQVWESHPERGVERNVVAPGNYLGWMEGARSFSSLSAMAVWSVNLAGEGAAERLPITYVTTGFHSALGAPMRLGRGFSAADVAEGAADVAVISEGLWRSRFAADPGILGREILLNGSRVKVVGVQATSVDFPVGTEIWAPMGFRAEARSFRGRYLQVLGRLAPGATLESARAEMQQIAARLAAERPDFNSGWSAAVVPLAEQLFGDYRRALWILLAATALVLLVACANLSGLLLARNAARRHELAVRGALGAGRRQLAGHLLIESLLLAVGGGALALLLARGSFGLLRRWPPVELPAFVALELDSRVLSFAFLASLACVLLFGLAPALAAARVGLRGSLAQGGHRALGRRGHRARTALVALEVALSLALVSAAGLLARSLATLHGVDPGFRTERLLTAQVHLTGEAYREPQRHVEFFTRLEERLVGRPGIEAVGSISWLPLGGRGSATAYRALDRPAPEPGEEPVTDVRIVTPGFFRAAGVRLLAGRLLDARDSAETPPAVVINQFAARELWPGEDPIGREIGMSWDEERPARVVGVVADLRLDALESEPRAALFWALPQLPNSFMSLFVSTAGRPESVAASVRSAVAEIDPTIPAAALASMDDVIAHGTSRRRFTASLLALFAGLGLTLSAIGLYGLLSSSVTERARELGLRMALGADRRRLLAEVVGRGLRTVLAGIAVGVPLVAVSGRLVAALLYRTSPFDATALALAPALLLAVGAAACTIPALRAARIDPAVVLREE
ncbi:MAG TPA: ABC transporter permease [Thermoanaerobaculia bacterium]|jgi:predicted permease